MKKFLALIMCLAMSTAIVGCGGDSGSGAAPVDDSPASVAAATTGSITVEAVSCKIVKDTKDADAVAITFHFKNGTSKKQNFKFAVNCQIKQGETMLTPAVLPTAAGVDSSLATKNLENGEETDVTVAYSLSDSTTAIDITCKPLSGEDKTPVTKQLTLA